MRIGEFFTLLQDNEEYSSASNWDHFLCQFSVRGNKAEPVVKRLHVHTVSVRCVTSRAYLSVMVIIGGMCVLCVA